MRLGSSLDVDFRLIALTALTMPRCRPRRSGRSSVATSRAWTVSLIATTSLHRSCTGCLACDQHQSKPVSSRTTPSFPCTCATTSSRATLELRELVKLRDRCVQELGDKVRQLHRVVDLCFPELTRHVDDLGSQLATTIIKRWPTAAQLAKQSAAKVARVVYDGRRAIGDELAEALVGDAKKSVGRRTGPAFTTQAEYLCEDIAVLRSRIKKLDKDMSDALGKHEVGTLLTTIDGIGENTAARLVAVLGNPADFRDAAAIAAYVGVRGARGERSSIRA